MDPFDRVRQWALSLPEVTERPSHGAPSFFIRGSRCFVMCMDDHHDDGRLALWCAAEAGEQESLIVEDPDGYFRPPYVGHRGWVGVRLDRDLPEDEIEARVRAAYRTVAPARLVTQAFPTDVEQPPGTASEQPLVVGVAIVRDGRLLVAQRAHPAALAGRWELPGGKVEAGESPEQALVRECREELGVEVDVEARLADLPIPGGRTLRVFGARTGDEPAAREHAALLWASPEEIPELDWLPADRPLVPALVDLARASG